MSITIYKSESHVDWDALGVGVTTGLGGSSGGTAILPENIITGLGVSNQVAIFSGDHMISGFSGFTYAIDHGTIYDDWFLPSYGLLDAMYVNLYSPAVGGFSNEIYWSATETPYYSDFYGWSWNFSTGLPAPLPKSESHRVRACRSFTTTDIYSLRDVGPAGGLIFHIIDNGGGSFTYFECAPTDQSTGSIWSNILTEVGTDAQDQIDFTNGSTLAIIGQPGHTISAAKLCNDLIIYEEDSAGIGYLRVIIPEKTVETNVVYYDEATGLFSYGEVETDTLWEMLTPGVYTTKYIAGNTTIKNGSNSGANQNNLYFYASDAAGTPGQNWTGGNLYLQPGTGYGSGSRGVIQLNTNTAYFGLGVPSWNLLLEATSVAGDNAPSLTIKGSDPHQTGSPPSGDWNGGDLILKAGAGCGSGVTGKIFIGTGSAGTNPLAGSGTGTSILLYNRTTGEITYGDK